MNEIHTSISCFVRLRKSEVNQYATLLLLKVEKQAIEYGGA